MGASFCSSGVADSPSQVSGTVATSGKVLAQVKIFPDRGVRPGGEAELPVAITDSAGRFQIRLRESDQWLIFEKPGFQRQILSVACLGNSVDLVPEPLHRVEKALLVRIFEPEAAQAPEPLSEDALRDFLFGRRPGQASAANYLFEVTKGALSLEEGAILEMDYPEPIKDDGRQKLCEWVIDQLKGLDLKDFDRVDNRTGKLRPDGKPDHLWVIPSRAPRNVTLNDAHLTPVSYLLNVKGKPQTRWPVVFFPDQTPLGTIVHELFHAMGEHKVDDLYLDCEHPMTAGIWDLMDAGQYRGWDHLVNKNGPWQGVLAYSPSHPCGWVRSELLYSGYFKKTVKTVQSKALNWTGWLEALLMAPGETPQRLLLSDPRNKGMRWELEVRLPLGFDRGRVGHRFGPGHAGLIVSHVAPEYISEDGESLGPVRVIDAHPDTLEPPQPRFPCDRWELDDAAFNMGPGEVSKGSDGPLSWEVLALDACGRMKVRVQLQSPKASRRGLSR